MSGPVAAGRPRTPRWTVDGASPGPLVSGVQLRVGTAATLLLAAAVAVLGDGGTRAPLTPLSVLAVLLLVVGTVATPTTPVPTLAMLVLVGVVVDRAPPLAQVVVVAALLHGVHLLVAWCAAVPPTARLPAAALRPTLRRWGIAQVVCLPVVTGVAAVRAEPSDASLAPVAGVVLLVLATVLVQVLRRAAPSLGR